MNKDKLLYTTSDWNVEAIQSVLEEATKIAEEEVGCNLYPMNVEIISSDQMLDALTYTGLPLGYSHWSFGKRHVIEQNNYQKGLSGLAYEIIINTNPCIAYLMENNTMTTQAVVLSHIMGHNSFFKNNYLFKQWTQADFIVDYMKFAKDYIKKCEEKYGHKIVEETLDACHALQYVSIDRYKRPQGSLKREQERLESKLKQAETFDDDIYKILPKQEKLKLDNSNHVLEKPEENILYFLEKNSIHLKPWQKEICRIVRKISQYFYPQMQTQVMNEGYASFCHYYIMNRLYEKGMISEGNILEFIELHSGVVMQTLPDFRTEEEKEADARKGKGVYRYSGINPYALGFAMFMDIKRVCEEPDQEDYEWFPDIAGNKNWGEVFTDVVENYRDESFIRQYLGPKVIRKFKFFAVDDNEDDAEYHNVLGIHNQSGYKKVRKILADQYEINRKLPHIQVVAYDKKGDRKLTLEHSGIDNMLLTEEAYDVLQYIKQLWGYHVELNSVDDQGDLMQTFSTELPEDYI